MGAIMRAYIVIWTLAVLAISAGIYAANPQIERAPPGYRWAEAPYEANNGKGVPQPLNPNDDNDDSN